MTSRVYCSFWIKTNDKRDRGLGRFLPRVKMSQVQNMGVLNHGPSCALLGVGHPSTRTDISLCPFTADLTTIIVPHLDDDSHAAGVAGVSSFSLDTSSTVSSSAHYDGQHLTDEQRLHSQEQFDHDVFAQAYPIEPIGAFTAGTMDSSARRVTVHLPTSTNSMSAVPASRSPLSSSYRASHPLSSSYNSMSGNLYTPQPSSSLGRMSHIASPPTPVQLPPPSTEAAFPKMPIQQAHGSTLTATASASTRSFLSTQTAFSRPASLAVQTAPARSVSQASFASKSTVKHSPVIVEPPSRGPSTPDESPAPSIAGTDVGSKKADEPPKKKKPEAKGLKAWWNWTTGAPATPEVTGDSDPSSEPTPAARYQATVSAAPKAPAITAPTPTKVSPTPSDVRASPISVPTHPVAIAGAADAPDEEPQPRNSYASRSIFHSGGQDGSGPGGGPQRGTPGSAGAEQNMRDGNGRAPERQWLVNPCNPSEKQLANQNATHRWQHILPKGNYAHQVKWKSLVTVSCVEVSPSRSAR